MISTTPGAGHVNPVVPFARAWVDQGHHVTWVTAPTGCEAVSGLGVDVRAAGIDTAERTTRVLERHPELFTVAPRDRRPILFAGGFAEVAAPLVVDELERVIRDVRPDLIVHEVAELAAPALAAASGVPLVTVAFSGALPLPVRSALTTAIEPVWAALGQPTPDDLGLGTHGYLHPFPPAFGQRPHGPNVRDVRPVGDDRSRGHGPPSWIDGLGRDRPLVYLTFGTEVSHLMPWPMLVAGIAAADVDAVVTTGRAVDAAALAAELAGDVRDRVRVEQYVPQSFVLPRADVVVSHGGAGTVLGAATAGVVQLVIPVGADQFDNADAVTGAGAGIELDLSQLTGASLADHLRHALEAGDAHRAATRVAEQIAAMPPPHESAALITA